MTENGREAKEKFSKEVVSLAKDENFTPCYEDMA